MPDDVHLLTSLASWRAIRAHRDDNALVTLRDLFAEDPERGRRFHLEAAGLYVDFSKQLIREVTLERLFDVAREVRLEERRDAMFQGAVINDTERRSVLHTALRRPRGDVLLVDGVDVVAQVHEVLDRMAAFAAAVREGSWTGHTGRPIRHVVNIGIGGSDLGPAMAYEALRWYSARHLSFHFVSNVDGTDLTETFRLLRPDETLFIVSSKTFTTLETLTNAHSARQWLVDALGAEEAVSRHFAAVSTNLDAVREFGIAPEATFGFWDWVGGRYSMESAIGLSTMIAVGPDWFRELLAGSHDMDEHFRSADLRHNVPAVLGLIGVWNRTALGFPTVAVIPYDQYLHRLPAYLQQLTMESNGKHVTSSGEVVTYQTGPVYWGEPGTNGQHSFFQLLHQGTTITPVDFIAFAQSLNPLGDHHDLLTANVLAQSAVLAFGRTESELRADGVDEALIPHRLMSGNRPSTVIFAERLTPRILGALIALYEHIVFVEGTAWGIDSFDQWGVELGKQLAREIAPDLDPARTPKLHDSSTDELVAYYRSGKKEL